MPPAAPSFDGPDDWPLAFAPIAVDPPAPPRSAASESPAILPFPPTPCPSPPADGFLLRAYDGPVDECRPSLRAG